MPTILRFGAYRVVIYTHDHAPAHVHVIGHDGEAIFLLNCASGTVSLRSRRMINSSEERKISGFVEANLVTLCAEWKERHGNG